MGWAPRYGKGWSIQHGPFPACRPTNALSSRHAVRPAPEQEPIPVILYMIAAMRPAQTMVGGDRESSSRAQFTCRRAMRGSAEKRGVKVLALPRNRSEQPATSAPSQQE